MLNSSVKPNSSVSFKHSDFSFVYGLSNVTTPCLILPRYSLYLKNTVLHLKLVVSRPYHANSGHTPNKGLPSMKVREPKVLRAFKYSLTLISS